MRLSAFILFAVFIPAFTQAEEDYTYYVDKSCTNRPEWDGSFKLALSNAKGAADRLAAKTDKHFERAVSLLFKVDFSNQNAIVSIYYWFQKVANIREVPGLKEARIRFFCDNDPTEQDPLKEHTTAEWENYRWSKRRDVEGYYDHVNNMVIEVEPRCLDTSDAGWTNYGRVAKDDSPANHDNQNEDRVVISICERRFTPKPDFPVETYPFVVTDEVKNEVWHEEDIGRLGQLITHTILHELMHAVSAGAIGDWPDFDRAYGWDNCVKNDLVNSPINADHYAILGTIAMLSEWNYCLAYVADNLDLSTEDYEEAKQEMEDNARDGILHYINPPPDSESDRKKV